MARRDSYEGRVFDLTSGQVARLFGVSTGTVRNWVAAELLPAIRTPGGQLRFASEDVEARREAVGTPELVKEKP